MSNTQRNQADLFKLACSALVVSAVICLALVACQAQPATSTFSPTTIPSSATVITPSSTSSPTPTSLDFNTIIRQFDYDPTAPLNIQNLGKPDLTRIKVELSEGVTLSEITYDAPGGTVRAYLLEPVGKKPFAGMLWVHKYPGDNTEFLAEAAGLAKRGVVCLLIQGRYPWQSRPGTFETDRTSIIYQILDMRRGLDLLVTRDDVDPDRIAVVGHDYGAMHSAVLAGIDHRVKAYVLMTPTGSYADWRSYFGSIKLLELREYLKSSPTIDPLTYVSHAAQSRLFFQFGQNDNFVTQEKANALVAAASEPKQIKMYDASHDLDDAAQLDRENFLVDALSLK